MDAVTPRRTGRPELTEPLAPQTRRIYRQRRDAAHEHLRVCARRCHYARLEGAEAAERALVAAKLAYDDYLGLCRRLNDDDRARGAPLIGDTLMGS